MSTVLTCEPYNPYPFTPGTTTEQRSEILRKNLKCRLSMKEPMPIATKFTQLKPISVAFPPCSDVLLSQANLLEKPDDIKDDIIWHFKEYFTFESQQAHRIFDDPQRYGLDKLDQNLLRCIGGIGSFPSGRCLPPSCVNLEGNRGIIEKLDTEAEKPKIRRLFIGDLVWLFYFERMGLFKILGVILDDFATRGKFPISNDSLIAIILETMVRQTKMGLSSTVRDRDSTYRRSLGWTSDVGKKLGLDTEVNTAFNTLFHKLIQSALEYYKDKRLATAIQATTTPGKPSVATLVTIGDTIEVLKNAFKPFEYGRNYSNTLFGIVWIIAIIDLIKRIKTTLGIPDNYNKAFQYIPAAYDLLVMRRPITPSEANRYTLHKECARDSRDILLDLEVLEHKNKDELEIWLDYVEPRIEGYRTAYRNLTGVDLGAPGTPTVEQQM